MSQKIDYLKDYFKYLKNPISCLLFKFGLKKSVNVKLKKFNASFEIKKVSALNGLIDIIEYQNEISDELASFINDLNSDKATVSWAGAKIPNYTENGLNPIIYFEYFNAGYWNDFNFDLKNRTAIDIGSNVGDSSLYFASKGADVYGFEPVKHLYEYSLKLKDANPDLNSKLHFFNMGVSDKKGTLNIDSMDSASGYSENESYKVKITTLYDILSENNIEPDFLKMDCEGCEFNIILNTDLSGFKDIIFEHHAQMVNKDHMDLVDKLKSEGFKINEISVFNRNFDELGLIHAYK